MMAGCVGCLSEEKFRGTKWWIMEEEERGHSSASIALCLALL